MNLSPIFAGPLKAWQRDIPRTPTNEERVQAFRALAPVTLGNAYFVDRLRAKTYEAQEMADGRERYATGDHTP